MTRILDDLRSYQWFLAAVVLIGLGWIVFRALPPRHLVIETGPVSGSYFRIAQEYAKRFAELGITLELRPRDDSLSIIRDVNDPASDVDIGFIAQAVTAAEYPNVTTLGSIGNQPLFLFYRKSLGTLTKPTELKGLRVELLADGSATSAVATAILNAYGVNASNATLRHDKLQDVPQLLKQGSVDVAAFVLAADHPLIAELMSDPDLRLMSLDQAAAIGQRLGFLRPLTIAQGAYDLLANQPPADAKVVAATVDVVVKKDLPPAIVYALMQFMTDLRSQSSSLSLMDEHFPSVRNPELPVNQFALVFYKDGMPWVNRELPLSLASLIDTFQLVLIPLIILVPLGRLFGLPRLDQMFTMLRTAAWRRVLRSIERDMNAGKMLTQHQMKALNYIERRIDPEHEPLKSCTAIAGRIREKYPAGQCEHGDLAACRTATMKTRVGRLIGLVSLPQEQNLTVAHSSGTR